MTKSPMDCEYEICFLGLVLLLNINVTLSTEDPNIQNLLQVLHIKIITLNDRFTLILQPLISLL